MEEDVEALRRVGTSGAPQGATSTSPPLRIQGVNHEPVLADPLPEPPKSPRRASVSSPAQSGLSSEQFGPPRGPLIEAQWASSGRGPNTSNFQGKGWKGQTGGTEAPVAVQPMQWGASSSNFANQGGYSWTPSSFNSGRGKGYNPNWSAPKPAYPNQPTETAKGSVSQGKGKGGKDGKDHGKSYNPDNNQGKGVVTPMPPDQGKGGRGIPPANDRYICRDCQREGKDFHHDWRPCKDSRNLAQGGSNPAANQASSSNNLFNPRATVSGVGGHRMIDVISDLSLQNSWATQNFCKVHKFQAKAPCLVIWGSLDVGIGEQIPLRILIDTGAEINLIRRNLLSPEYLQPLDKPITLTAANAGQLAGGDQKAEGVLHFRGIEVDTGRKQELRCTVSMVEADITIDAILSYGWMAEHNFLVNPRRHGICHQDESGMVWVEGIRKVRAAAIFAEPAGAISMVHTNVTDEKCTHSNDKPITAKGEGLRMLDLFAGTGSIGREFEAWGYEFVSVDILPKYQLTLCCDVMVLKNWEAYPPQHFHVIACTPPCTEFSTAMTRRERQLETADRLVQKALEIVDYFQPDFWFLENPRLGCLKSRPYMEGIPYLDVDYCQFATWGYQKPTRIWGSACLGQAAPSLCDGKTCANLQRRPHGGPGHRLKLGATLKPEKTCEDGRPISHAPCIGQVSP